MNDTQDALTLAKCRQDFEEWVTSTADAPDDSEIYRLRSVEYAWGAWQAAFQRARAPLLAMLKVGRCPNQNCTNGSIVRLTADGEVEQEQCQWCDERAEAIRAMGEKP